MRSIPATYNNTLYRSRTEARWRIFYDATGIEASYEMEALDLGGLTYVPDYYLGPPFDAWNEIKGEIIDDEAGLRIIEKCTRLAQQSGRPVILNFHGPLKPICAVFRESRMYAESRWTYCALCGQLALKVKKGDFTYTWCPRKHEGAPLDFSALRSARRLLYDAAMLAHRHRFGIPRQPVL